MLIHFDVGCWSPNKVIEWLSGLRDDSEWVDANYIMKNTYDGRKLLMATASDLHNIGAVGVDLQETILEVIERLRIYNSNITRETLQTSALRLASQSRALHEQLVANRIKTLSNNERPTAKSITLSKDFLNESNRQERQRVDLDTLAYVSAIVKTVKGITHILNSLPFSKNADYRSMKSLILALSIELTSTAQRDQFVDRPNDILEKSSKALADYCYRIVCGYEDLLFIQPFQLRTVRIRKSIHEHDLGLVIMTQPDDVHYIEKIVPLSPAKKTNELHEGDEIIYLNQFIIGWSAKNIQALLASSVKLNDVTLIVIKSPNE